MLQAVLSPAKGQSSAAAILAPATRRSGETLPVAPIADPPAVVETATGFEVVGFARVDRVPGRNAEVARRIAARIAARPSVYLPLMLWVAFDGVDDLRPTFGKGVARA